MLKISELSSKDINRKVVYMPDGQKTQEGRITSFNDKFIFVDYQNVGRGQATPPSKLYFL